MLKFAPLCAVKHAQDHGGLLESDEGEADEAGAFWVRAVPDEPAEAVQDFESPSATFLLPGVLLGVSGVP